MSKSGFIVHFQDLQHSDETDHEEIIVGFGPTKTGFEQHYRSSSHICGFSYSPI